MAGTVRTGYARRCMERFGIAGMVWLVLFAFGLVRLEWFVGLRRGHVRQGLAWQARFVPFRYVRERMGSVRQAIKGGK